jgi:hypothetical protein
MVWYLCCGAILLVVSCERWLHDTSPLGLAAIIIIVFYLLVLYLLALSNTPKNLFASIYSESLSKTACQHLLLLVGFDTLIYQKYYDTPLYLWVIILLNQLVWILISMNAMQN